MSKTRDTGFLGNVVKYDANGNVTVVNGATTLLSVSSSGQLTVPGDEVITGSLTVLGGITGAITGSATSASYAANASLLNGSGSGEFVPTGSFNTFSSSILTYTGSVNSQLSALQTTSGSNITRISALEVTSGSNITRISALETASGSAITRLNSIESKTGSYATTGSNTFDGGQYLSSSFNPTGFSTTASLYTDGGLRVTKDAYISGTLYLNNVTVFGTQSVAYISSSQLNIGTNLITVNTDTPSIRFGGLAVYDSGSTGLTGSILWDSQNNHWVYSNPSGSSYSGGMFISGPRTSTLGSETGTTSCMLMAGQGGDHITSSMIYHSSTVTCIPTAIVGGSTACFASTITACNAFLQVPSTAAVIDILRLNNPAVASSGTRLKFENGYGDLAAIRVTHRDNGALADDGQIEFQVGSNAVLDTKMTILNTGNVGIGTLDPIDRLMICGEDSGLYISNSSRSKLNLHTCGCGGWQIETNNTGGNQPGGALGITETGASSRFQIAKGGVACFSNTVCVGNSLIVGSTSTFGSDMFTYLNGGIFFSGGGSYNAGIFGRNGGCDLILQSGGIQRVNITSTGIACFACQVCTPRVNVQSCMSIGNIATTYARLDINQDGSSTANSVGVGCPPGLKIYADAGVAPFMVMSQSTRGTMTMGMQAASAIPANFVLGLDVCGDIIFKNQMTSYCDLSTGTALLFICRNGNVGIGTTVGTAALGIGGGDAQTTANLTDAGTRKGMLEIIPVGGAAGYGGALVLGSDTWGTGAGRGQIALKALLINGSGCGTSDLAFSLRNDPSCSNLTERMRITSGGLILACGRTSSIMASSGNIQEWVGLTGAIANDTGWSLFSIANQYDNLAMDMYVFTDVGSFQVSKHEAVFGYTSSTYTGIGFSSAFCVFRTGTTFNETMTICNLSGSNINSQRIAIRVWGYGVGQNGTGGSNLLTTSCLTRIK